MTVELISKVRNRAIINGVKWYTDSNIELTIETKIKMIEYGGEEHAILAETNGGKKDIGHILDNKET